MSACGQGQSRPWPGRANNLAIESDEILEEDFHYYDEESIAFCGTQDFIHFLEAYAEFIA